jgi:2-keto-4-pentenoate hydratase
MTMATTHQAPPSAIDESSIVAAAELLHRAAADRQPCPPVRHLLPDNASIRAAYSIQECNTRRALKAGRRLVGRKVGLTSIAVQQQLGVDQPDFGMLYADMQVNESEPVELARILQAKVEAEIALVLKRDLVVAQPTIEDLIAATDYACAAIEIVDSRIANWDIRLVDTVADNASSGLFVLGKEKRNLDGIDLSQCKMKMHCSGEVVSSGSGAACMGNPVHAAVWLATKMVEVGRPLSAGDIILTGALGPMVAVHPGYTYGAVIDGLETVKVSFAGE